MKILVADKFEAAGLARLNALADQVLYEPQLEQDALAQRLAQANPSVLIVRSTRVPEQVMAAGRSLKLIVRAGSGYDTIDVAGATRRDIRVANCPGMNATAVAELTVGLIIALDRRIPDNVIALRARRWNKKEFGRARGLKGRTLGLIGLGRIGRLVARRALAFEMQVLFYDVLPEVRGLDDPNCKPAALEELLRSSDFISIHVPGGEATRHLINEARLALMRPEACLINTSRASVIDEAALLRALKDGRIRAAALDLYENEPPADGTAFDSPLADLPNLYGTHHIGASTEQAQLAVAAETVRIVSEFKRTGRVPNCVN